MADLRQDIGKQNFFNYHLPGILMEHFLEEIAQIFYCRIIFFFKKAHNNFKLILLISIANEE